MDHGIVSDDHSEANNNNGDDTCNKTNKHNTARNQKVDTCIIDIYREGKSEMKLL